MFFSVSLVFLVIQIFSFAQGVSDQIGPLHLADIRSYTEQLERERPCGLMSGPYAVRYKRAGRMLTFVAADHAAASIEVVKREFFRLKPAVIIVEGLWLANATKETIDARAAADCDSQFSPKCFENTFSINLANKNKVSYVVGEPTSLTLKKSILDSGYTKRDVLVRFLLGRWDTSINEQTLPDWFNSNVKKVKKDFGLGDLKLTLMDLKVWYSQNVSSVSPLFQFDGNLSPKISPKNRLEKIWAITDRVRDITLMQRIEKELKKPRANIMVVYGGGHWLDTAVALKTILGNPVGVIDSAGNSACNPGRQIIPNK